MEQQLILDRYRPLEELGEGGFGTVTLAWDTRMQRRVAIKRLPLPQDSSGTRRLDPPGLAEARTAAMLNHRSIVTVYDFETDADEAFLIMEHVDGASLETILDDLGAPLDLDETAEIAEAVADALEFAHSNGVLHLDIKPANVLVGRDGRAKVADFGLSALSSLSGHGPSHGGTPGYMPLEQLEGLRVSETTDEWAFAALVYECLTAENPFDDATIEGAIVRLETLETPLPSTLAADLPAEIDDVLLAALGPRPADRYPAVADFADALLPLLGEPAEGRASLAEVVQAYVSEEPQAAEDRPGLGELGAWDRLQGRAGQALVRVVAALEAGWLAWAGLGLTPLQPGALLGAAGLVAVAAVLAPPFGAGLGLLAFAAGLFAHGLWVAASAFVVVSVAWWWYFARRKASAAVLPLAAPVLGVARIPYAMPLLAGFALPVVPAAAAGLVGGALSLLASAASASSAPYSAVSPVLFADPQRAFLVASGVREAFANPASWVALAGWPVAGAIMSLGSRRASRLFAAIGAVLGAAALYGAHVLARMVGTLTGPPAAWDGRGFLVSLGGSLILVLLVTALGAPVRAEEEDLVHAAYEPDE